MAVTGPAAKAAKHGRTGGLGWTEVPNTPYDGPSPSLPAKCGRRNWHPTVLEWYGQIRHMPHCAVWSPTDWTFAVETAYMKQQYWTDYLAGVSKTTAAVEIRRREDQMGTTLEARRKLLIRYLQPAEEQPELVDDQDDEDEDEQTQPDQENVRSLEARRRRLLVS